MKKTRILIVDDEPSILRLCQSTLSRGGKHEIVIEEHGLKALELLKKESFDLLITDLNMPEIDGVELTKQAREIDPDLQVLVVTGYPTVDTAVKCMKHGATDYITKPFSPDDLSSNVARLLEHGRLASENRMLSRHLERVYAFDDMIGGSPAMQKVFQMVAKVAPSNVDVMICGETGTGKEVVARALHNRSRRAKERFVPVNSGAIPDNLLESELFGHERGAFTGADQRSVGLLEFADKGTFFLDEIGELPLHLQAKMLRILQERRLRRIGGKEEIPIDVRIVAATAVDMEVAVKQKKFRDDLYFRINVLRIDLPPLRERGEDILMLADHFLARFSSDAAEPITGMTPEVREVLMHHRWPGNVRELQNAVRRAIAMAQGPMITVDDLPDSVVVGGGRTQSSSSSNGATYSGGFFAQREERINAFEVDYLKSMLAQHNGDVAAAAVTADIPRGTYYRLLKKHNLTATDFRDDG